MYNQWESREFPSVWVVPDFALKQDDLLRGLWTFFNPRRCDRVIAEIVLRSQLGNRLAIQEDQRNGQE